MRRQVHRQNGRTKREGSKKVRNFRRKVLAGWVGDLKNAQKMRKKCVKVRM
jgi:hypothetical protein